MKKTVFNPGRETYVTPWTQAHRMQPENSLCVASQEGFSQESDYNWGSSSPVIEPEMFNGLI